MHSLPAALALVVMNTLLIVGAWRLARVWLAEQPGAEQIVAAGVIASVQIVVSEAILGLAGWLRLPALLLLNAVISLIIIIRTRPKPAGLEISASLSPSLRFLTLLGAGVLAFAVLDALRYPPLEYDSLAYLLPSAIEWLQAGRLFAPDVINPLLRYYPGNSSLVDLWLIMPLRSDALVQLVQIAYLVLASVAVFALARRCGATQRLAVLAALLLLLVPQAVMQASTNKNDLVGLFFLCASILFAVGYHYTERPAYVWLWAGALGLLLGNRYATVAYLPFLLAGAGLCFAAYGRRARAHRLLPAIFAVVCIIIACGGFWYVRNWLVTGNPTYPGSLLRGGVGGLNMAGSWTANSQGRLVDQPGVLPGWWLQYLYALGPAGVLALLFAPLYLLALPARSKSFGMNWWHLGWLPIIFLALYFITPHSAENMPASVRYAFPAVALSLVSLAGLLSRRARWEVTGTVLLFLCVIATAYLAMLARLNDVAEASHPAMLALYLGAGKRLGAVAAVALIAVWLAPVITRLRLVFQSRPVQAALCVVSVIILAGLVTAITTYREDTKFSQYAAADGVFGEKGKAFAWLATHKVTKVMWVGDDRIYPLYGPAFATSLQAGSSPDVAASNRPGTYVIVSTYPAEYIQSGGFSLWPKMARILRNNVKYTPVFTTKDAIIFMPKAVPMSSLTGDANAP
jgi:hypothetical protein